jgi:hypothetical protein
MLAEKCAIGATLVDNWQQMYLPDSFIPFLYFSLTVRSILYKLARQIEREIGTQILKNY